jgi:hypothetical protein
MAPQQALDLLYKAVRGEKGSRYYGMTERQTRCVTINYQGGMHIDLSPAELTNLHDPRRSNIFHSKPEDSRANDKRILTNSFGFVEEYNARCPIDKSFQEEYSRRVIASDRGLVAMQKDADSLPVPDHSIFAGGKSAVTVALQLIKRNRNIRWANRGGRMPASVMLSCLTLEVAEAGRTIAQNTLVTAQHILNRLVSAQRVAALIHVENQRCPGDVFTDRWPENHANQNTMITDMRLFLSQLAILLDEREPLNRRTQVLKEMFGENVGQSVVDDLGDELGHAIQTGRHGFGVAGGLLVAPAQIASKPAVSPSTFYGTNWPPK